MNLTHLKYAVEVEKTSSINKAAENLYMGQPNLSRAIRELEEYVGIKIFNRTPKGITTTEQGQEFLLYAKNILTQVDDLEAKYKEQDTNKVSFKISVPRGSYITDAFTSFVKSIDKSKDFEFSFNETNSMNTIKNLTDDNYNLGIIRYQATFEPYFMNLLNAKEIKQKELRKFSQKILISKENPLAKKDVININDLNDHIEIAHGDPYVPSMSPRDIKKAEFSDYTNKKIFVFERASQFSFLGDIHNTFMWTPTIPAHLLDKYNLVQKKTDIMKKEYKDVLIYHKNHRLSSLEKLFIKYLEEKM